MRTNFALQNISSIIVAYKSQINEIAHILECHQSNFLNIIIVNNSSEISLELLQSPQVTIINNKSNIGLASALIVGILEAKKQGAKMVALFDSGNLIEAEKLIEEYGENLKDPYRLSYLRFKAEIYLKKGLLREAKSVLESMQTPQSRADLLRLGLSD